jgi:IS1 transposase
MGSGADGAFVGPKARLVPCGVTRYYADKWGACRRHLPAAQHTVGTRYLRKIERKPLTLRTRLKRWTQHPRAVLCQSTGMPRGVASSSIAMNLDARPRGVINSSNHIKTPPQRVWSPR